MKNNFHPKFHFFASTPPTCFQNKDTCFTEIQGYISAVIPNPQTIYVEIFGKFSADTSLLIRRRNSLHPYNSSFYHKIWTNFKRFESSPKTPFKLLVLISNLVWVYEIKISFSSVNAFLKTLIDLQMVPTPG